MDGGAAGGEGDVPEDVEQRADGADGERGGVDGEAEAETAGGGGQRGRHPGLRADHEDRVRLAAEPACALQAEVLSPPRHPPPIRGIKRTFLSHHFFILFSVSDLCKNMQSFLGPFSESHLILWILLLRCTL